MAYRQDRRRHADEEEMEVEQKRRRGPETRTELAQRVVDLIVSIGNKNTGGTSLESNLEKLVALLEGELEKIGQEIINSVVECAKNLPDKLTIYSTLVGLLNAKNYNFGGEIVERLIGELQTLLETEAYRHAVNLVTFICDLGNCRVLSLTSVVEFLEGMLEAASEDGIPQVRSDWFVFSILRALPWIGGELNEKKREELENLLGGIEAYVKQRSRDHIRLLQVWTGSTHEQEEYLDCLHEQIKLLAGSGWQEKHIQRLYIAFDATLSDALQHNLPTLAPPPHLPTSSYPIPYVVFRLFDYADCPEDGPVLPGAHSVERHLIEDELGWIIELNQLNRRDCAQALINYTHRATVPLPYAVLETIFGRMFALPESPQPRLFYGALLIELCRIDPERFPQVLAQAAELLYERSHEMQPTCLDRFIDWFSYHLSNFQYRWSWQDWTDCLEADVLDNKFVLAREVLEKCMRFSYYERICEILPESHERLRPAKPDVISPFSETHPDVERARRFQGLFQEKATAEQLLDELRTQVADDDMADGVAETRPEFDENAFSVFFAVLLKLACKSFSHNFAALTRYHRTLKHVVSNNATMQTVLLNTLYGCWRNNTQMLIILIDKLLKMQILECYVVVNWIFHDIKDEHNRQWVWEVLNSSLEKLGKHVAKVRRDLDALQRAHADKRRMEQESGDIDGDAEMEGSSSESLLAVHSKEAEVEALCNVQRTVFVQVFQKFAELLGQYAAENGDGGMQTLWWRWTTGRMRQVFLQHQVVLSKQLDVMKDALAAENVHPQVKQVYQEFRALWQ